MTLLERAHNACLWRLCPRVPCSAVRVALARERRRLSFPRARNTVPIFSGGSHLPRASLPLPLRGHAMASSSSQQGAREPPPPDQLAAFYSLTDKVVTAGALNRHSRTAELSARAALKAEALFPDDSLVVAHLLTDEINALANLSATASGAEKHALLRRCWSALLLVIALLQRRRKASTLLPGTVRKEESHYYAHVVIATCAVRNKPPPHLAKLQTEAASIGYIVLLDALYRSLNFMFASLHSLWPAAQRKIVESFVRAFLFNNLAADACPGGGISARYLKPWTSFLAQLA